MVLLVKTTDMARVILGKYSEAAEDPEAATKKPATGVRGLSVTGFSNLGAICGTWFQVPIFSAWSQAPNFSAWGQPRFLARGAKH